MMKRETLPSLLISGFLLIIWLWAGNTFWESVLSVLIIWAAIYFYPNLCYWRFSKTYNGKPKKELKEELQYIEDLPFFLSDKGYPNIIAFLGFPIFLFWHWNRTLKKRYLRQKISSY